MTLHNFLYGFLFPLLIWGTVTGIGNFLLSRKSQIEHWAEANPRAAAWQKLFRAIGFDPWSLVAAWTLAAEGRLPFAQKAGATVVDGKIKPPSIPPAALLCLAALAILAMACASEPVKPPCDASTLATITAACSAQAFECGEKGIAKEDCAAITECKAQLEARREQCR